MKTLIAILLCGLILSSCSPAPPDVAKVRKDIEALQQKNAKDMMSGMMDTTFAQYTDDAIYMPDHEPMIKGKIALKENSRRIMAMGMKFPKVEFITMDVQVIGSYAYEVAMERAGAALSVDFPRISVASWSRSHGGCMT